MESKEAWISITRTQSPSLCGTALSRATTAVFTTSTYGVDTGGTAYRGDDVPIPPRPALVSPNAGDEVVLKAIAKRIRELQGVAV
jgi:formylmethanofuran dehydrogenase subunit B